MSLKILSCLKLKVGGKEVVNVGLVFIGNVKSDERKSTKPDHHCTLKIKTQKQHDLAEREHKYAPEIVG